MLSLTPMLYLKLMLFNTHAIKTNAIINAHAILKTNAIINTHAILKTNAIINTHAILKTNAMLYP